MKLDSFDLWTISNENKFVTCFKNNDVIKNFNRVISHQHEIKKIQVFSFFIIFIQLNDIFKTKDYVYFVFVGSLKISD